MPRSEQTSLFPGSEVDLQGPHTVLLLEAAARRPPGPGPKREQLMAPLHRVALAAFDLSGAFVREGFDPLAAARDLSAALAGLDEPLELIWVAEAVEGVEADRREGERRWTFTLAAVGRAEDGIDARMRADDAGWRLRRVLARVTPGLRAAPISCWDTLLERFWPLEAAEEASEVRPRRVALQSDSHPRKPWPGVNAPSWSADPFDPHGRHHRCCWQARRGGFRRLRHALRWEAAAHARRTGGTGRAAVVGRLMGLPALDADVREAFRNEVKEARRVLKLLREEECSESDPWLVQAEAREALLLREAWNRADGMATGRLLVVLPDGEPSGDFALELAEALAPTAGAMRITRELREALKHLSGGVEFLPDLDGRLLSPLDSPGADEVFSAEEAAALLPLPSRRLKEETP